MPGIFIGVGGIGGSIVTRVQQELKARVAIAGDSPAAQARADQFQFFNLDTTVNAAGGTSGLTDTLDLPPGQEKFSVDRRIRAWHSGGDDWFKEWWPVKKGSPVLPGDFFVGAGQVRVKGKLAYRIALTGQQGPAVMSRADRAVAKIQDVLGVGGAMRPIPVYIVCSLSGGSGSGMVLTLAQHLRNRLPGHCQLIGCFLTASVAELASGQHDKVSMWANADAALREIDYCQRKAGEADHGLDPFFTWGSGTTQVELDERAFQYSYVFTRNNMEGKAFQSIDQYVRLVSETLIAESFSDLMSPVGTSAIDQPHSQFAAALTASPETRQRSNTYASAAVGELIYPAERIARHLARRYATSVLDRVIAGDDGQVNGAVDSLLQAEKLRWEGSASLQLRLRDRLINPNTGAPVLIPPFRTPLAVGDDQPFMQANRAQAVSQVNQAKQGLDADAARFRDHIDKRRGVVLDEYSAPLGGIRHFARQVLATGGPGGLGLASVCVRTVRQELERQWSHLNDLIEGAEEGGKRTGGKKADLQNQEERWAGRVKRLENTFGSGITRIFGKNGRAAKEQFEKETWRPYQRVVEELQLLDAGRALYRGLIDETRRVEAALDVLVQETTRLRRDLALRSQTDLGQQGFEGSLDVPILDDPRLVDDYFGSLLAQVSASGVVRCAQRLTIDDGMGDGGLILAAFDRLVSNTAVANDPFRQQYQAEVESFVVLDGTGQVTEDVKRQTIWDALTAEFEGRQRLGMEDEATKRAQIAAQQQRDQVQQQQQVGTDWGAVAQRFFMSNKLDQCIERVRPFWQLDDITMNVHHVKGYGFTILGADEVAYRNATNTLGIANFLQEVAARIGSGSVEWLPGKHSISVYSRYGVVPLFCLAESERDQLAEATRQMTAQGKFLYTDRRLAKLVDPKLEPGGRDEEIEGESDS